MREFIILSAGLQGTHHWYITTDSIVIAHDYQKIYLTKSLKENHKNEGRVITNSPQVAFQKYITNVTILLYFPNHVSYYYISRLVIRKPFIVEDEYI